MDQIGLVRNLVGDKMEIEVKRISSCGDGCASCGSSCDDSGHRLVIPNELEAKVGDLVEIKGEVGNILKYTFVIYMIPFLSLVAGIVLGHFIFKARNNPNYELLSFFVGIIFLLASFLLVRLVDKRIAKKNKSIISAVRIL